MQERISRKKKRLTLISRQEKKSKLTGPTVIDDFTINPPRKNQPLPRPWLTPTPSTSEAAKPANFKTPKQPVPKTSAVATENTATIKTYQMSMNTATEPTISNSNETTSPSTSTQPPSPPQSKSKIPPVVLRDQPYFSELRRITSQDGI
ncbi:hypothetical protein GWI33_019331 [Rhynchophorus ferrugineus]|uniref:Uncharacterized protein n=1 Tax=Rhynchophorus ferrugineus TaxID=354439 RepID=A0A834HRX2_RHYFE|nr:hypothetical protein GWI33_019331 [Rhynchophorus ferrugineus]